MTYTLGGSWGDKIQWSNPTQFKTPGRVFDCTGWKDRTPKVGDYLEGEFTGGRCRFVFTEVRRAGDPPDMFFAKVGFLGFVHDLDK